MFDFQRYTGSEKTRAGATACRVAPAGRSFSQRVAAGTTREQAKPPSTLPRLGTASLRSEVEQAAERRERVAASKNQPVLPRQGDSALSSQISTVRRGPDPCPCRRVPFRPACAARFPNTLARRASLCTFPTHLRGAVYTGPGRRRPMSSKRIREGGLRQGTCNLPARGRVRHGVRLWQTMSPICPALRGRDTRSVVATLPSSVLRRLPHAGLLTCILARLWRIPPILAAGKKAFAKVFFLAGRNHAAIPANGPLAASDRRNLP